MGSLFAAIYDPLTKPFETALLGRIRKSIVSELQGNVLEIGSGTGANFPYYARADSVTAVEPDPYMRERCSRKGAKANVPVILADTIAEQLPFQDNTFDAVVGTLVLCTIPDPAKALTEAIRVSKPGSPVTFFEHVRARDTRIACLQDQLTPVWKNICHGCHLNRDTLALIKKSGLQVYDVDTRFKNIFLTIRATNTGTS